jgi:WD40 repeat protein
MNEFSGLKDAKRSWPKFSLLISALLWLLAWELIVWFVPIQPRAVIPIPNNDGVDPEISENLAGFSPDGKLVVTTVERIMHLTGQFHLWGASTGEDLGVVGKEGTYLLPNVVYWPQRDLLSEGGFLGWFTSAEGSRTYILYDLIVGKEKTSIRIGLGEDDSFCLCISPDGNTLACCTNTTNKGDLKVIDVQTGQVRCHLEGGKYGDWGLTFSRDGRVLATTETYPSADDNKPDDQKLVVLDIRTGESRRIPFGYGEEPFHIAFSPDGTKLAVECWLANTELEEMKKSEVRVWDLTNGKQTASFEAHGLLEFVEDGKGLALWNLEEITFCDSNTGKQYAVAEKSPSFIAFMGYVTPSPIPIPSTHLLAVQISHHSKPGLFFQWCATYLGIKSLGEERNDQELAFLDTKTGKEVAAIIRPGIGDIKVFPDGTKLALTTAENEDSVIEIWDIPPRKPFAWVLGFLTIPSGVTLVTLARWWKAG